MKTDQMAKFSTAPANSPQQTPFQDCLPQAAATRGTEYPGELPHLLTLSLRGMPCASCTTAINEALSRLSGVRDVSVSLLGHSATAILDNNVIVGDILEAIQVIGYEADFESSRQGFHTPSDTFGSIQSGLPLPWHCRK